MSDRRARLIAKFKTLAAERLETLNNSLVSLEARPDDTELIALVMREIHTLKGEAKLMGFADVNLVAHKVEDLLLLAKDQGFRVSGELFDFILKGFDAIGQLMSKEAGETATLDLNAYLERADGFVGQGSGTTTASAPPAATPPAPAAAPPIPPATTRPPTPKAARAQDFVPITAPAPAVSQPEESSPAPGAGASRSGSLRVDVQKIDALTDIAADLLRYQVQGQRALRALSAISNSWRDELDALQGLTLRHAPAARASSNGDGSVAIELKQSIARMATLHGELDQLGLVRRDEAVEESDRLTMLERTVRDLRLLPLSSLFGRYPRAIRDLAREQGKQIRVAVSGGELEIDEQVLAQLDEPLLHLIRNAVDHGLESPDERRAKGKSEVGSLSLLARQAGTHIEIVVSDDGRGVSADLVRQAAVARGVLLESKARTMDRQELINLIFLPAFSTRARATDVSGRGIGLDVVKDRLESLGGSVRVEGALGRGAAFVLRVPTSVALMRALVVMAGGVRFAIPSHAIDAMITLAPEAEQRAGSGVAFRHGEALVPLHDFCAVTGLPSSPSEARTRARVAVVQANDRRAGFRVDAVVGERELVQRPFDGFLDSIRLFNGSAMLEHADPTLIINVQELMRQASEGQRRPGPRIDATPSKRQHLILLAEDSELNRDMLQAVLRDAGHEVLEAANGRDALDRIHQQRPDLVLTDLEMPVLDGFGLIKQIRNTPDTKEIPIIVLSSLGSAADKQRAAELGADAYLVKSEFREKALLETIERLLEADGH